MKKSFTIAAAVLCIVLVILGISYFRARGEIASLTQQVTKLNSDVAEKDKEIGAMTDEVEKQSAQIESMNAELADKSAEIEQLTTNNEEKDSAIEGLNADLAERESQIEDLKAGLAESASQIEGLNADVAERDSRIEDLHANVAEKDSQIEGLNADLENKAFEIQGLTEMLAADESTAENLDEVSSGRYNNTKRFLRVLDEQDYYYTVAKSDDYDTVSVPMSAVSDKGRAFSYTAEAYFAPDNTDVAIRVWNLIDFSAQDKAEVEAICAQLNKEYRWLTFYIDESDNSVSASIDCLLFDGSGMGEIVFEAMDHVYLVVTTAYDYFYLYAA